MLFSEVSDGTADYDVTALIGEGGMGQVYRATDTQLHRDVALKILPDAFAADPDRLARFQREAQVLASLNHPGVATSTSTPSARGPARQCSPSRVGCSGAADLFELTQFQSRLGAR